MTAGLTTSCGSARTEPARPTESYALACSQGALACYPNCERYEDALSVIRANCVTPAAGSRGRATITVGTCGRYQYIHQAYNDIPPNFLWVTRARMAFYETGGGMIASAEISDTVLVDCPFAGSWGGLVPRCELRPTEVIHCR